MIAKVGPLPPPLERVIRGQLLKLNFNLKSQFCRERVHECKMSQMVLPLPVPVCNGAQVGH